VKFVLHGICEKDKYICPPKKPQCGSVCRAKLESAVCDEKLGWICPPKTIACGKKCQEKWVGGVCQDDKIVCPHGQAECGKKCAKNPEGSTCVLGKQEWRCPDGSEVCGNKCQKTVEGTKCTEKKLECKKGEKECAGKCLVKPKGSFCCRKEKTFVCKKGFKPCKKRCKRFIKDAVCVKAGWACAPGKIECGGKCVEGPQGGTCNPLKQTIECPQLTINCKKKCVRYCPLNCGACDKTCDKKLHETCNTAVGKCVCKPGRARCNGPNKRCINVMVNTKHCGKCNNACNGEEVCNGGQCVVPDDATAD